MLMENQTAPKEEASPSIQVPTERRGVADMWVWGGWSGDNLTVAQDDAAKMMTSAATLAKSCMTC